MANYFKTDLGPTSAAVLYLIPISLGDTKLYFRIGGAEYYTLQPGSKVRAMIVPSDAGVPVATIKDLLKRDNRVNDILQGYYYATGGENNSSENDTLTFDPIKIENYDWENTKFDLHWMVLRGGDELYGSNLDGVYLFPHNVQSSEVQISGNLLGDGRLIQYQISWDPINNEDSADYGSSPTDGPYYFYVGYKYFYREGPSVSGFEDPIYYPSGTMDEGSGITIVLPFHDERKQYQNVPAIYNFRLGNISAGSDKSGTKFLNVTMDHQVLIDSNKYFANLDNITFTHASKDKLKKVGEVEIEPGIINRKRLSLGINDVSVKDNTYVKQGIYVSNSYPMEFNIYTFSLKVDEMIPSYPNIDPYSVIKYFVEFNSNKWEQISPINRKDEYNGSTLIPKMFIFDKASEDASEQVKYIDYNSNVNSFRIKIVFDLSKILESKFTPPEVRDYKCIIYDKDQFFNL